jgi:hypothetical protein
MFTTGGLGIDLGRDGVTLNDSAGHTASGANYFQNFPVLNSAFTNGTGTTITGSFSEAAEPNTVIALDFYANAVPNSSGYGQGQTYLGSANVTTDGNGNASFSVTLPIAVTPGQWVTATATDPGGNTSEFALDLQAQQKVATITSVTNPINPSVLNQSVTFTATVTPSVAINLTPTGTVQFQIDGNPVPGTFNMSGGAASFSTSALTVGTHTITAIYNGDGSFLGSSGTFTETVYSAQQQDSAIIAQVNALVAGGYLVDGNGNGQGNALISKLNAATNSLNATPPNKTSAVSQLNAFITQVNVILNQKKTKLTSTQASSLITAANLALAAIQGTGAKLQDGTGTSSSSTDTQPVTDAGQLVTGELDVYLVNADGSAAPADEQARFDDAITALDTTFGPNGVDLVDVGVANAANAVVQIQIAGTSAAGSAADGVLGCTVAGNITLLTGWTWFTGADATTIGTGQYDFQTIVMHELGHAIGLGHSGDTNSVMYAYLASGQTRRVVTAADLSVLDSPSAAPHALLAAPWRDASNPVSALETGFLNANEKPGFQGRNRVETDSGRDLVFAFAGTAIDGLPAAEGSETRAERWSGLPSRTENVVPVDAVFASANQSPIFGVRSQDGADEPLFDAEKLDDYVPADFSSRE